MGDGVSKGGSNAERGESHQFHSPTVEKSLPEGDDRVALAQSL
jgi:hypothetical protein